MCGVEDISVKLKQRRLRWFGHVKRVEGACVGWGGGGESGEAKAGKKA